MVERVRSTRRRIMRDFVIKELSAVDRPAQGHALAVLMKRADDENEFDKANLNHDEQGRFSSGSGGGVGSGGNDRDLPAPRSEQARQERDLAMTRGYSSSFHGSGPKAVRDYNNEWEKQQALIGGPGATGYLTRGLNKNYGNYPQAEAVRAVGSNIEAMDFEEVLAGDQSREAAHRVKDCVWSSWNALQRSFDSIAADDDISPADKVSAMQESLGQFLDAVRAESKTIADTIEKSFSAVPALAELLPPTGSEGDIPMTDAEKRQLAELQKSVADLTSKLEAATAKEPAKKAADLQEKLDKAEVVAGDAADEIKKLRSDLAEVTAKAGMSDSEKEHMAGLSGADKMKFMQASPEDRKKMMSKAADADPVIYKAADGTEFRKSDGDKVVALAKRADESEKLAKAETEKREIAELSKRADDELKFFSEDVAKRDDKIEALRGIEKMPEAPRAALLKMLQVGGKAVSAAFDKIGHSHGAAARTAGDFNKRVDEVMARDKIGKLAAMEKAQREYPDEFAALQASGAQLTN